MKDKKYVAYCLANTVFVWVMVSILGFFPGEETTIVSAYFVGAVLGSLATTSTLVSYIVWKEGVE